jgi:hypothetical protein
MSTLHFTPSVMDSEYWAGEIFALRYRLPQYVRDLLDEVESHSENTCDYFPLIPELRHVAHVSEMIRDDEMDVIRTLIRIIEDADKENTPISKPLYKDDGSDVFRDFW